MTIINCDMGEAFGLYRMGDDEAIMPLITAANVACGFHASDFNHMRKTVRLAKRHGVRVGAHPSLQSLMPFWKDRSLAIVHAAGSPDASRSHFDAQDFMEAGTPGSRATRDGFLTRALHQSKPLQAISMTQALPRRSTF